MGSTPTNLWISSFCTPRQWVCTLVELHHEQNLNHKLSRLPYHRKKVPDALNLCLDTDKVYSLSSVDEQCL